MGPIWWYCGTLLVVQWVPFVGTGGTCVQMVVLVLVLRWVQQVHLRLLLYPRVIGPCSINSRRDWDGPPMVVRWYIAGGSGSHLWVWW